MAVVKVYDQDKTEQGELTLTPEVFEVAVRPEILHLVVRAQLAAKRAGTHSTKTRAMVSGGGVKPWRQKGTGRARAGSNRSPVWRGGAILFGPQPRKYDFKVNKKIRIATHAVSSIYTFSSNKILCFPTIIASTSPFIFTRLHSTQADNNQVNHAQYPRT